MNSLKGEEEFEEKGANNTGDVMRGRATWDIYVMGKGRRVLCVACRLSSEIPALLDEFDYDCTRVERKWRNRQRFMFGM